MIRHESDVIHFILQSSLFAAAKNGHTVVVEMLLKAGADVNKVSHQLQLCITAV